MYVPIRTDPLETPDTAQGLNSTINDIRNVEGNASLECEAGERVVTGTVAFKNCH